MMPKSEQTVLTIEELCALKERGLAAVVNDGEVVGFEPVIDKTALRYSLDNVNACPKCLKDNVEELDSEPYEYEVSYVGTVGLSVKRKGVQTAKSCRDCGTEFVVKKEF